MSLMINKPTDVKTSQSLISTWKGLPSQPSNYFGSNSLGSTIPLGMVNIISLIIQALQQLVQQTPQQPQNYTSPITVKENANGTTTLNSTTYSNDFLRNKFEEFKRSPAYPDIQTRDLRTTAWGYQGSGSALNAFYNYMLTYYANGETTKPTAKMMSATNIASPSGSTASAAIAPVASRVLLEAPVITTETVAATTADTTAATPTSTATPQDAVVEAAVTGNLSSIPLTATAVSAAPAATTD